MVSLPIAEEESIVTDTLEPKLILDPQNAGIVQKLRQDFGYPRKGEPEHDYVDLRNPCIPAGMQRYGRTQASDSLGEYGTFFMFSL